MSHTRIHFIDSMVTPNQRSYRLKQMDLDGTIHYTEPVNITVLTSVKSNNHPIESAHNQNFPNPFNPTTSIPYNLAEQSVVSLRICDILGGEVRALVDGVKPAGYHQARWDGTSIFGIKVGSGLYFYRIEARSVTSQHLFSRTR